MTSSKIFLKGTSKTPSSSKKKQGLPRINRRDFLKKSFFLSCIPWGVPTLLRAIPKQEISLVLHHAHTGETWRETVIQGADPCRERMALFNHFMRDHRRHEVCEMDPNLVMLLSDLARICHTRRPVYQILCGYRSPETNKMLRRQGHGVAKNSRHLYGKAIDLTLQSVGLSTLKEAAWNLKKGGVGYYPKTGFIHVDIRSKPARW